MQSPKRILLFGDGAWAANSLAVLHKTGLVCVIGVVLRSHPSDQSLAIRAHELGIPILQPDSVNGIEFIEHVKLLAPDLNISISYNQIFGPIILSSTPLGTVNFHAGKLPFYRGRNVINWAIINGEVEIGLSAHFVDEGIDTGDVIMQEMLPINWTDTYGDVLDRLVEHFPSFVWNTLERITTSTYTRRPQDPAQGTYFAGREVGDEWLDWSDTSFNLHNKVRAISRPGPGGRTMLGEEPIIVWKAFYDQAWAKYIATPGQVVGRLADGVLVKTGDSTLLIKEVEFAHSVCVTPHWPIGTRVGINPATNLSAILERLTTLTG